MTTRKRLAVLISGRGSNMQALMLAAEAPDYPAQISLVISNNPGAQGLAAATAKGIETAVIDHRKFAGREDFDAQINAVLHTHDIDFVACAGFMRIMTDSLINDWAGRIINIHPSLLPSYRGLNTHERALEDGVKIHGCTVHFVIPELDAGPIIAQAGVPVAHEDTAETLAARVLAAEHILYPQALAWVASGDVMLSNGAVVSKIPESGDQQLFSPRF